MDVYRVEEIDLIGGMLDIELSRLWDLGWKFVGFVPRGYTDTSDEKIEVLLINRYAEAIGPKELD